MCTCLALGASMVCQGGRPHDTKCSAWAPSLYMAGTQYLFWAWAQQASSHFQNILEGRALCCNPAHLNRKQLSSGRCMEDSRHNGVIAMFLVNRTF